MKEIQKIFERLQIQAEIPFCMSAHTTIGVGGNAAYAVYPTTIAEAIHVLHALEKEKIPYYVVGNMSNVLPCDKGTDKAIVNMKKLTGRQIGSKSVFMEAGVTSGGFLRSCRTANKGGGEFLVGIPCTIGGALYMNAGVSGRYISEIIDSIIVWLDGKTHILSVDECEYAYKSSIFMQKGGVILGATFRLNESSEEEITMQLGSYLKKRAHLPKGKSMGCVFKNPQGYSAGGLIERAGLKGMRSGDAYISDVHANFIINEGNATSADITSLIELIKRTVFEKYTIALEEEIRYLT